MPRRIPAIVLTAALLIPATALARDAASQEATAQPSAAAQPAANLATAAKAVMNPAGTVEALNQKIRENQEQNQAAISALNQAGSSPAPSAPAPKPGGGKVIYGDIIIHK